VTNYLVETRDTKRLNDITELYNKIDYESQIDIDVESLMNETST
jgi:hypothetical protein